MFQQSDESQLRTALDCVRCAVAPVCAAVSRSARTVAVFLGLSVLPFAQATHAQDQGPSSNAATVLSLRSDVSEPALAALLAERRDALGRACSVQGVAASGELRFLACGAAGLWIVRLDAKGEAQLLTQQLFEGFVTRIFIQRDGKIALEITNTRLQEIVVPRVGGANAHVSSPAGDAAPKPVATARTGPPMKPQAVSSSGRVVSIEPGFVLVEHDDPDSKPWQQDDHVRFYGRAVDDIGAEHRDTIAVGLVTSVGGTRSRVELGLNERVAVGSSAERTALQRTAATFAPPRAARVWDLGFIARGLLVLDDLGIGAFADAHVGYHFEQPIHLEALVAPVGFATARRGGVAPFAGVLFASYDTQLFEVGLGAGGQTVLEPDISLDPGSAVSFALRMRLGSRDGAYIEALPYMALFHSNFTFSMIRVHLQIPVGRRAWLHGTVSASEDFGFGHGELGLRLLTTGNGGPGSFYLEAVIGGANVFRGCKFVAGICETIDYAGPSLGMGGEWRL
ncbi:MAG: hypothetical protein RL701_2421 [Pseudomonadota bacterium]